MVVDMPGNAKDYWAGVRAVTDTCNNQPDLAAELKNHNFVHVGPWNSGMFHLGTKRPWKSLSELKGRTFRSFGGAYIDYFGNLGINSIFMSYSEIYEAMDRGTIFGNQCVLQLSDALKHYEVMKQVTYPDIGFVVGGSGLALNRKVWSEMPKDIQDILHRLDYDLGEYWAKQLYEVEDKIKKEWKKKGVIMNELSPEDSKISKEAVLKAQEKFLSKLESQGLPAKKVWDYFRGQVVKYEKEVKEKGHPWKR
jgi:C4-dicarboxylate-binding protein DctP